METEDIKIVHGNGDAGVVFNFECPICHESMENAEHQWWNAICKCGHIWDIELKAVSRKVVEAAEWRY